MSVACPHCRATLPPVRVSRCPNCNAPLDAASATPAAHQGTRLESVQQLRSSISEVVSRTAEAPRPPVQAEVDSAAPFRPSRRPPTAVLCLWDDDGEDGEFIRLRDAKYVLGRTQGQIIIPHDSAISGQHAEIYRTPVGNRYRWVVKDLSSTNGVYAAVTQAVMNDGQEFIVGGSRFRFELPAATEDPAAAESRKTTQAWSAVTPDQLSRTQPSVVRIVNGADERRHPLTGAENWIGTDAPRCAVVVTDDPMVSKQHANLTCDSVGRWKIESGKCRNRLWLRVKEMPVETSGEFLIGEQRFQLRVAK